MEAKLIHKNKQPFFRINGTDYPPVAFMSYVPRADRDARFRDIGVKFFSFSLFFGDRGINPAIGLGPFSENFWKGYGEYDFTGVDAQFEMAAPDGKGAFIFPRVFVDAPIWWHEQNPGELCRTSSGLDILQSYASEKWRADVKVAIEALIDHIRESKWCECVFGFHCAYGGTEECTYKNWQDGKGATVDRSSHSLRMYRDWLREQYGNIDNLRDSWAYTSAANVRDFDDVEFPQNIEIFGSYGGVVRDTKREMHVIDYLKYHSYQLADTLIFLCKCVKDYTNGSYITGGFFGYIMHFGAVNRGHNDCYDVFTSPYVDFVTTAGAGFTFASAFTSAQLHGKLWFAEGDIRTDLSSFLGDNMPEILPPFNSRYVDPGLWKGSATPEGGLSAIRRGISNTLTRNAGIWFFDMFGGWFDSPDKMNEISLMSSLMEKQALGTAVNLKPRVAVIMDEVGQFCYGGVKCDEVITAMNEFPNEIRRMGTPYSVFLADDLADEKFNPDDFDLYIMLCCVDPTERVKAGIKRIKSGGRTIVWMHMAAVNDPSVSDFTIKYDTYLPRITCHANVITKNAVSIDYPKKPSRCGRFSDTDIALSYPLAYIVNEGESVATGEPSMLFKKLDGYNSVYCLTPSMPHQLLLELASFAGVFVYSDSGDYIFAGGCYIGIFSSDGGEKRLDLPHRINHAYDAMTGEEWVTNEKLNIPMALKPGETRLFYLE